MKERTDSPSDILGMTDLQLQRGGVWMTANLLVGNTTLPAEALSRYGTFEGFPSGVPIVLDLANAQAHPIDPLMTRYAKGDRTRILAAVPGPWLKITGAGDCLYVRTLPKVGQYTGCFKDGVLLRDRGETRSVDGTTWIAVSAPGVAEGWASADYLETAGRDMRIPPWSHPIGTRTGNAAIDSVLEAIESGHLARQIAAVRFTSIPCTAAPEGLGAPPKCADAETEGTPIEVLPESCGEGYYRRKTDIDASKPLIWFELPLYAVIKQQRESSATWPTGGYSLIYRPVGLEGLSVSINVDAGEIVSIDHCQGRVQDVLKSVPSADIILPPPR